MNTNKGITIGGTTINNLRYADDTVLLAESESHWETVVTFDTKINAKKTKTMLVSKVVISSNKLTTIPTWDKQ